MNYVKIQPEFLDGLNKWIKNKRIDKDEIVEVFAGSGELGQAIGLPVENITDNFSWQGAKESLDYDWIISAKENVYKKPEDAIETINRFVSDDKEIKLLIMSFPPDNNPIAYEVAKKLSNSFPNALILYIGTDDYVAQFPIATSSFFEHTEDVDDDSISINNQLENFDSLVRHNYNHKIDYEIIYAILKKFTICEEEEENCTAYLETSEWCRQ